MLVTIACGSPVERRPVPLAPASTVPVTGPFEAERRNVPYLAAAEAIRAGEEYRLTESVLDADLNGDFVLAFAIWAELVEQALVEDSSRRLDDLFSGDVVHPWRADLTRLSGDLRTWRVATSQEGADSRPEVIGAIDIRGAVGTTVKADVHIEVRPGSVSGWLADEEGVVVFDGSNCTFGAMGGDSSLRLAPCLGAALASDS